MMRIACVSLLVGTAFAGGIVFDPIIGPVGDLDVALEAHITGGPISEKEARFLTDARERLGEYSVDTALSDRLKLLRKVAELIGKSKTESSVVADGLFAMVDASGTAADNRGLASWEAYANETDAKIRKKMLKRYEKGDSLCQAARDLLAIPDYDMYDTPVVLKYLGTAGDCYSYTGR